jgi:acyl-coenzyme A thioesterase PaaI-like protein
VLGANVLTSLAPDIYKAADMIGRELVGIMPSVTINGDSTERAAKGQPIRSHFTRPATVNTTFAPAMVIPEGTDQTVDNKSFSLNQYASVQIPWTGEDVKYINNGVGFQTVYGDQVIQAMRAIVNKIEGYAWGLTRAGASRAWGTAGTTPFASNFNEVPQIRKILVDNGCPMDGAVSLILDTTAGANLRSLAQLQKANEAGGTELLRQGTLLNLSNLYLKESAAPVSVAGHGRQLRDQRRVRGRRDGDHPGDRRRHHAGRRRGDLRG